MKLSAQWAYPTPDQAHGSGGEDVGVVDDAVDHSWICTLITAGLAGAY